MKYFNLWALRLEKTFNDMKANKNISLPYENFNENFLGLMKEKITIGFCLNKLS